MSDLSIAERFGWTLDYIDSLPLEALSHIKERDAVMDGTRKALDYIKRTRPKG